MSQGWQLSIARAQPLHYLEGLRQTLTARNTTHVRQIKWKVRNAPNRFGPPPSLILRFTASGFYFVRLAPFRLEAGVARRRLQEVFRKVHSPHLEPAGDDRL